MDLLPVVTVLTVPVAAIMAAALVVAMAGLLQYRLADRVSAETRVVATLAIVGAGAILSVVLTSRTLDEAQLATVDFISLDDYAKGFAASRWLSLLLIGAAFIEIVRGAVRAHAARLADPAAPLLWAMLAFHLGVLVIQSVGSDHTGFSHKDLYLPTVLAATWFLRIERIDVVVAAAKWILFVLTAGSLAGIAVSPDFVIHRPEPGLIPGVDWRLFGLTSHANAIGPAALVAIVLELARPSSRRAWRLLHLGAALAVFVLAQSRTAWVAALAITVLVVVPLALRPDAGVGRAVSPAAFSQAFPRATWTLVACLAAAIAAALGLAGTGFAEQLRRAEVGTLNGRLLIWDITLHAWRENPWFGYGSDVWGVERQWRFHMFHVGHAHNQVVQTLGESGLAGLALLAAMLGALLRAALQRFRESRGLVLALLVVVLARCVTEAPMRSEGLLTWSTFLHVLVLVLACHFVRLPRAAVAKVRGVGAAMPRPAAGALRTADGHD